MLKLLCERVGSKTCSSRRYQRPSLLFQRNFAICKNNTYLCSLSHKQKQTHTPTNTHTLNPLRLWQLQSWRPASYTSFWRRTPVCDLVLLGCSVVVVSVRLLLSWKHRRLDSLRITRRCCSQHLRVAGPSVCSEAHSDSVTGRRAGSGLSVIGSWPRCGQHCKTLCFPGSFCLLKHASWLPVRLKGKRNDRFLSMGGQK